MKLLWAEDRPTFSGTYYQLDEPPYRIETLQQPHPPILIGGGSDAALRVIARHAAIASPMLPLPEAKTKVAAYCAETGRDPGEIRWAGGGSLFLHDDPTIVEQALRWAVQTYGEAEEGQILRDGLFGSAERVRASVRRQIAEGATEVIVFQLPRVHMKSLMRFSDDIVPAFA
jgi:alkanesulfonate monooxygenase SsuD/methylene tetrahydromethanopterin reductase-like flavin-dependent oxidoreductase (luciferase family)